MLVRLPSPADSPAIATGDVSQLLRLVESFESARLTRALLGASARLGPLTSLETMVAPLLRAVGDARALVVASAGCRILYLGTETPISDRANPGVRGPAGPGRLGARDL